MIEPTDEMVETVIEQVSHDVGAMGFGAARDLVVAVLAIVERDQAGPCSETLPLLTKSGYLWCQLRHGHLGDHEMGPTRWKEARPAAQWRCNTTERCFREDGHDGPHGFAGVATEASPSGGDR